MTTTTATNSATITVRRTIEAPAEELFDAWLDAEAVGEFMRPGDQMRCDATIDPRVGGTFSINMHSPTKSHPHRGTYRVIERPRRLVFTWISEATGQQESLVTVEFKAGKGNTEIVLTHEQLPEATAKGHIGGWTDILELLAKRAG